MKHQRLEAPVGTRTLPHPPPHYRCPDPVLAKEKTMQHRERLEGDCIIPEMQVDFVLMGGFEDQCAKCIIVAKDRDTRLMMSTAVPLKEASHEFPLRRVTACIKEFRLAQATWVSKSDQVLAIRDLIRKIARMRSSATTLENESPLRASDARGCGSLNALARAPTTTICEAEREARQVGHQVDGRRLGVPVEQRGWSVACAC